MNKQNQNIKITINPQIDIDNKITLGLQGIERNSLLQCCILIDWDRKQWHCTGCCAPEAILAFCGN